MGDTNVQYTLSLTDLLTGKLAQADQSAKNLDATMGGLQNTINKVGMAFGVALGIQGVKQFAGAVIDAGTTVENAQTGLTTLLKNAGEAKEVIQNTMADAQTTPFAFEGLLAANKALIAANVNAKEARGTILDLANAIAATGGGDAELQRMVVNLQQIKNTGKASAMDIRQFAFAGINIYQLLADATGLPVEKTKDLSVSYDLLRFALRKAHAEGGLYANGLENMANNTSVQISNLGDSLFKLKVTMFNDLKPALTDLIATGMDFIKWLGSAWEWVKRNHEMLEALGKGILTGVIALKAYKLAIQGAVLWEKIQYASITLLGDGFLTATAGTKLFAGGMQMLKAAMLSNPIGLMAVAVGALASAFFLFDDSTHKATASLENFNMSLMKTDLYVDKVQQKLSKGIYTDQGAMIDKMNAQETAQFRDNALAREKEIKDKIDENDAAMNALMKKAPNTNNLNRISELEDANKILAANLLQTRKSREQADAHFKKLPKGGDINNKFAGDVALKQTHKVTGSRTVTINIHINELIHDFTVKTTTITESAAKIAERVTQTLLSAVNDSQIVAGQNS
jgi:tape measure domain-containing protein